MIVVADTTPLHYLVLLNRTDLLPRRFGTVIAPEAVRLEMQHASAPAAIRVWALDPPEWLSWRVVKQMDPGLPTALGAGEREALSLAIQLPALLLIDDQDGRQAAAANGVTVTGTLGVLLEAALAGLCDLPQTLSELRRVGFWLSDATMKSTLRTYDTARRKM